MKGQGRTDSLSNAAIIVPNVPSFLTGGDGGNDIVGCDEEDSKSNEDVDYSIHD
jgi:hypothetical protein